MYVGIDIGGTKTLVASLDDNGVITQKIRFETERSYDQQHILIRNALAELQVQDFHAGAVGIPAVRIDRQHGRGIVFSNLPWQNVAIESDLEQITRCPITVENDAKLAGLSEAMLVKHEYSRVLYLTISTGIGMALINNRQIDTSFGDGGGRTMTIEHRGELVSWEHVVSGRATVERFGKMAKDLDDPAAWQAICRDLAKGMIELIALLQPEIVVIGGSVGTHFNKYGDELQRQLKAYETPLLPIPPLRQAGRPEEAVLFGAYDLAKERFSHANIG